MAFIRDECSRFPLTADIIGACHPFSCGDKDLDEFFCRDYDAYQKQLMGKTYVFIDESTLKDIVCAFTVSNASIFTNFLPNARKKKVGKDNKTGCRYLVVDAYNRAEPCEYYQRNGFSFMFSTEEQEKEYRNIMADGPLKTRLMYFDLMQIVKPEGDLV